MASFTVSANPLAAPGRSLDERLFLNGPQRFGIYVLVFYLFVVLTRLPEILSIHVGHNGSIVLISTLAALALVVLSGSFQNLGASRLTIYLVLMHLWICLTVPFSLWRGGSIQTLRMLLQVAPMYVFIGLLIRGERQFRLALGSVAASTLFILAYTMIVAVPEDGDSRLATLKGRFGNSNDLALFLLIGLPFWIYFAVSPRFHIVWRLIAGIEIGVSLFQILRTGSRGGLITVLVLGVVLFFISSAANKLRIAVLAVATILISVPLVPDSVRNRLASLTDSSVDESASGSATARMNLLLESIRVTARYPLFGAGLGMYTDAAAEMSLAEGSMKLRQVPHNTFTSISAETGLPGLLFYLLCLGAGTHAVVRARRLARAIPGMQDYALMCGCLLLTLGIFVLNNFFFSLPGDLLFYLVCGLCLASLAVAQEKYSLYHASLVAVPAATTKPASSGPAVEAAAPVGRSSRTAGGAASAGKPGSQYGDVPWARSPRRGPR